MTGSKLGRIKKNQSEVSCDWAEKCYNLKYLSIVLQIGLKKAHCWFRYHGMQQIYEGEFELT